MYNCNYLASDKIQGTPNNEHLAVPAMLPSHPSFWRSIHLSIHTLHLTRFDDSQSRINSPTIEHSTLRNSTGWFHPQLLPFEPENTPTAFWHLFRRPLSSRRHDLEAWAKDSNMTVPDDDHASHGQYHEQKQHHDHHNDHHRNDHHQQHQHHHHQHHQHHHHHLLSTTTLNQFVNYKILLQLPTAVIVISFFAKALTSMP